MFKIYQFCIFFVFGILSSLVFCQSKTNFSTTFFVPMVNNQVFRDEVMEYIRNVAIERINQSDALNQLKQLDAIWNTIYQKSDWSVQITLYHHGQQVGIGTSHGESLANILKLATEQSMSQLSGDRLTIDSLKSFRFKVVFDYYPSRVYSFIEYKKHGLELIGNRVAVRKMDIDQVDKQIVESQDYLLKSMDPKYHGFFKFYNAELDRQEDLLRTIYSSSSLYTLIKLYETNKDKKLLRYFKPIAQFILSNQVKRGADEGGFYYGINPKTQKRNCNLVVGTASKTIFTLLELNRIYPNDPSYLEAATRAGNWLLKNINDNGKVTPIVYCSKQKKHERNKQSFLYSGQVLSALSRLYKVTHDSRYQQGAAKIVKYFIAQLKKQGTLVGDEYRPANSISTSWVLMALIDFAKIDNNSFYRETIQAIADTLLSRQLTDQSDIYSYGRYLDAMTSSGNGWINEVMGVLNEFCIDQKMTGCQRYQKAVIRTSRWLMQNAYTRENTYSVKNPERAIGGFITNFNTQTVRTDAVCHGLNSLLMMLKQEKTKQKKRLLFIPEKRLIAILPLMRAGNGDKHETFFE